MRDKRRVSLCLEVLTLIKECREENARVDGLIFCTNVAAINHIYASDSCELYKLNLRMPNSTDSVSWETLAALSHGAVLDGNQLPCLVLTAIPNNGQFTNVMGRDGNGR